MQDTDTRDNIEIKCYYAQRRNDVTYRNLSEPVKRSARVKIKSVIKLKLCVLRKTFRENKQICNRAS